MSRYTRQVNIPGRTSQELYDVVSQDLDRFLTKASLGKFQIERNPADKEFRIQSTLFSATLCCSDAQMELHAQLSLLAMPFKSKFDESITRWLSKTFNLSQSP